MAFTKEQLEEELSAIEYAGIVPTWEVDQTDNNKFRIRATPGCTTTIEFNQMSDAVKWCWQMVKTSIDRELYADDNYYTYGQRNGIG